MSLITKDIKSTKSKELPHQQLFFGENSNIYNAESKMAAKERKCKKAQVA